MMLTPEEVHAARAARHTGVVHSLAREALVEVRGPDAARYLQAVCTRDLADLAPGGLRYAALIDDRARYVADFWVWRPGPDTWWLECVAEVRDALVERLRKFAVADDVEIEVLGDLTLLHVEGPEVERRVWPTGSPGSGIVAAGPRSRYGEAGWTLALEDQAALGRLDLRDLVPAAASTQESLRIEAGRPRGGVDVTSDHLLPEAGLWGAVSLDKGCFPGQEIVRRVVTRGDLKRRLVGFVEAEESGAVAEVEATSVAFSAGLGKRAGLGWTRSAAAAPGTPVRVMAGTNTLFAGRLAALPLVPGPRSPLPDTAGEWTENATPR